MGLVAQLQIPIHIRPGHGLPNGGVGIHAVQGQMGPAQAGPSVQAAPVSRHLSDPGSREDLAFAVDPPQRSNTTPVQRTDDSTVPAPTNQERNALVSQSDETAHPRWAFRLAVSRAQHPPLYPPFNPPGYDRGRVRFELNIKDVSERNRELYEGSTED